MPAKRLPWFKMWPEAMRHEKIALLSDALFRTWVKTLADGSEQATRWRFANVQHAAGVTGRPAKHIRDLIAARLLDERSDGEVWVHDWRQWQDRYESDFTPKPTAEDSVNAPSTLRERSDLSTREERGEIKEERREKRELEPEPNVPGELVVAGGAGGAAVAADGAEAPSKSKRAKPRGTKPRTEPPETLEPNAADYARGELHGMPPDEVDSKAATMLDYHRREGKDSADWHASLRTWLDNARLYDQPRAPNGHRNGSSKPPPRRPGPPIPTEQSAYLNTRNGQIPRR